MKKTNNKHLIFTTAINHDTSKFKNELYSDYCIKSWKFWCDKNNIDFLVIDKHDKRYKYPVWVKDIIFELVGDTYEKLGYVDGDTMVHWNAPNPFDLYTDEFCWVKDSGNLRWNYNSINIFNKFYPNQKLNVNDYYNSGVYFFTKEHKYIFDSLIELYENNKNSLDEAGTRGGGKVQTVLNFELKKQNVKVKELPMVWNMLHMHKKEMFNHNWQLNEDKTPFFIKYSNIWHFTGFGVEDRINLMRQTWELTKDNYTINENEILLNSVRHKDNFRMSTSRKFKKDLIDYFSEDKYRQMKMIELGACHGDTTKVFSKIFKSVHAVDWKQSNIDLAKERCKDCDNITYQVSNIATDDWDYPKCDVVFVDANHEYPQLVVDIQKALDYFDNPIIVLDDYGNSNNSSVRKSIDEMVESGKLKIKKYIGEYSGFKTKSGWSMNDREGVICTS